MLKTLDKKLPLGKAKPYPPGFDNGISWKSAMPFVENQRGILIHRPVYVTVHKNGHRPAHTAIHYYCGGSAFYRKGVTFLAAPPAESLLCPRCETAAVHNGLPSAESLAGCHVHLGKVVGVKLCCEDK